MWKGDEVVADIEELGKFGRVRSPCSKAPCKGNSNPEKGSHIRYAQSQMEQQNCLGESMESEDPLQRGTNL